MKDCNRIIILGVELVASSDAAEAGTREVVLVPPGMVKTKSGSRSFLMDAAAAEMTIAAFREHGVDVVIDYEHQTLPEFASPNGRAPASGWIKTLRFDPAKGLVGEVEWTSEAAAEIASKKYRYLSPVVNVRTSDKRVFALHSAGLTNKPAIERMQALAASERTLQETETPMGIAKLRAALGLPDDATDEAVIEAALAKIGGAKKEAEVANSERSAVRKALGLTADANAEAVANAAAKLRGDAAAKTELVALREELDTLKKSARDREVQDVVDYAVNSRRVSASDADKLAVIRAEAQKDPVNARVIVNMFPEVKPPQGRITPTTTAGTKSGASARAQIEELVAAKEKLGKPRNEAWAAVMSERPELREALVEEENQGR